VVSQFLTASASSGGLVPSGWRCGGQRAQWWGIDVDETDTAEGFELPGADLSGEELSVRVVPKQADEFTCSTCFLVHHRHRAAGERALSTQACRSAATARHNRTSPSLAASAAGVNHFSELEWASTGLSAMMGRISVLLGEHGRG
jgi:hypothetical protein